MSTIKRLSEFVELDDSRWLIAADYYCAHHRELAERYPDTPEEDRLIRHFVEYGAAQVWAHDYHGELLETGR